MATSYNDNRGEGREIRRHGNRPARVITATFQPRNDRDLMEKCRGFIGKRCDWLWEGHVNGGRYDGTDAWSPVGIENWPGWVPTEDLADIEDFMI